MFKKNKLGVQRGERPDLISYFLLQKGDIPDGRLTVTWVDVAAGSGQKPHEHFPEQVYVIIKGRGRMRVGGEEQEVSEGDLVYIPPNTEHSIENISSGTLSYVSASTPPFDITEFYDNRRE